MENLDRENLYEAPACMVMHLNAMAVLCLSQSEQSQSQFEYTTEEDLF